MRKSIVGLGVLALSLSVMGCEDNVVGETGLTCGPGTMEVNEVCVPVAGGQDGGACGPGTFPMGGVCVPFDPSDTQAPTTTASPAGSTSRTLPSEVKLTSDEAAIIYYTTDGTEPTESSTSEVSPVLITGITSGMQIKFFAKDPAGNSEAVKTETYTEDRLGPGPVTGLAATATTNVALAWTNPTDADFAGVIVLRQLAGIPATRPTDGTGYAVNDMLGNATVVYTGTGTAHTDTGATLGQAFYAVWAFDSLMNYSPVARTNALIDVGAQTGQIQIADPAGTPAATVTTQPTNFVLAVANPVYNSTAQTLTLDVTITNMTGRLVFNPKLQIDTQSEGAMNDDGQIGGKSYRYFGNESLDIGGSKTRNITLTGITGASTVTLGVNVLNHRMIYTSGGNSQGASGTIDSGDNSDRGSVSCDGLYQFSSGSRCDMRSAALSPDGRYLYGGSRAHPVVQVYDTTNNSLVGIIPLAPASTQGEGGGPDGPYIGSVLGVALAPGGEYLYAVVSGRCAGGDRRTLDQFAEVQLVRVHVLGSNPTVDALTLSTRGGAAGRGLVLNSAGTLAAVAISRDDVVALIDLVNWSIIDTDSGTAGTQHIDTTSVGDDPKTLAFNSAEDTLWVGFRYDTGSPVATIDMSTYAVTAVTSTLTEDGHTSMVARGPNGAIWVVGTEDTNGGVLRVFDGASETNVTLSNSEVPVSVGFTPDGTTAILATSNDYKLISVSSKTETGTLSFGRSRNHFVFFTPF